MTDFNPGDRVHVDFDGTVKSITESGCVWVQRDDDPGRYGENLVPAKLLDLIATPFPTKVGAVMRNKHLGFLIMLGRNGKWRDYDGGDRYPVSSEIWEVLFEGVE